MTRYSLWEERWIPVTRTSGEPDVLSIRDVLSEAHCLREVFDPSPLVTVAIHRLLMAVLYRVYRPRTKADWADLWRAGRFDAGRLDGYGAAWADQFDLLHPTRPFYQVPKMADEKIHPITALVIEAASGNNPTLFDHGKAEGGEGLPLDRAACHLVAHQLFAIGGGVSKPFNRMDGPLTKGLVVEARGPQTLFETLLLNLIPLDLWQPLVPDLGKDKPFWEVEEPPEPAREGSIPFGPMYYLTWQSRQIHLCVDGPSGLVTGCQIRQRYCLPKDGRRVDPGKAYKKSEKEGWLPFKVDKQRAAWQFTHVLLQTVDADLISPYLSEWLATVRAMRWDLDLEVPEVIGLNVCGLTTDPTKAAKIELWRREQLPVPMVLLERPDLVFELGNLLAEARRVEGLLNRTAQALMWALGEHGKLKDATDYIRTGKAPDGKVPEGFVRLGAALNMVTRYWPALEAPFRQALKDLPEEPWEDVRERWRSGVRTAATQAFRAARDSLLYAESPYEALTRIEHAFQSRLTGIFAEKAKGDDPADDEESD